MKTSKKGLIVIVDDEITILDTIRALLRRDFKGYHLEFAESAEEGLEIVDEYAAEKIPLLAVMTDWLMPGMKGHEFLSAINKSYPNSHKIILSGMMDYSKIKETMDAQLQYQLISKPWNGAEIINSLKEGLIEAA